MKPAVRVALCAFACSVSNAALAQAQSENAVLAEAGTKTPATNDAQRNAEGIQDIVVTATRRKERLQDVPVSVSAINAASLDRQGITGIRELTRAVPGLFGGRFSGSFLPVIRGVGSAGISPGDEPNVAVYVDGIYQPSSRTSFVDLVEVERVEVLRGPQGTIFGRNTTGGLINVITPDPSFDLRGKLSASYGRFGGADDFDARGYITGGLTSTLAADLAFLYRDNGNFIDNIANGNRFGHSNALNLRGKLLFKPSDTFNLMLTYSHDDKSSPEPITFNVYNNQTLARSIPGALYTSEPFKTALSLRPDISSRADSAALRAQLNFSGLTLESSTAFYDDHWIQTTDPDGTAELFTQNSTVINTRSISEEIRLLSDGNGRFKWLTGIYFFNQKSNAFAKVFNGIAPAYIATSTLTLRPSAETTAWAGFGEGTYSVTDRLKVTLGGRYSYETRWYSQLLNESTLIVPRTRKNEGKFTYRGAVTYEVTPSANVYFTYSTGFKSGVFNTLSLSSRPTNAETIKSIEGGVKADPASWLRTNFSIFNYNYSNLQVTAKDPITQVNLLLNAASARIYGAELEIQARPNRNLNFTLAGSWLHARYRDFPAAQVFLPQANGSNIATTVDVSGKNMTAAPNYTIMAGAVWTHDFGNGELSVSGNVFHSGRVYFDFGNLLTQKPYTTVSGEIAWQTSSGLRLGLFGKNMTNAVIAAQIASSAFGNTATYEHPRELGIRASFAF